ncbi:glycosyltransferase family 4 protein [Kallotenue papyrolyticum]|uniref:glycosyltransferase family 4 protein n=1 Tax=Kallotenue papyrolyticum TaxID=1325125 RepID=UPI0004785AB5|nr:glycosyltransferase family 4 protein [Kallotenue papyrolyticum]
MTLRIAMLIQRYYPLVGGAERQVGALAPLLRSSGLDVQIVTRRYAGLADFELIDGVPVHRLPIPGPKACASLSYTLCALPLLRRLRPDLVHAHELFSPATTALLAKHLLHVPVIATLHRSGAPGDVQRLRQKLLGTQRLALFKRYIDLFVCISQEIRGELMAVGVAESQMVCIPNGVDPIRFAPVSEANKRELRRRLGLPEGPLVIFSGRLVPEKRVQHLLAIWPALRQICPQAVLVILGTGPLETELRAMAGAGVVFAGLVDDVHLYYQAADIFVLPSVAEGLSVAMLEAMATGLAVVVTDVGGAAEVINAGQHGLLVPPDDPMALQTALLTLLLDAEQRRSFGLQARQRVLERYALPAVAQQLISVYQRLRTQHTGDLQLVEPR